MSKPVRLDEWYRLLNSIYLDRNFYRSPESIFVHLIEVTGGLSLVASNKKKPGVTPEAFMAKSVGWWMVLCGKVGIRSVEALVWTKFPYACPYCQKEPHETKKCDQMRQQSNSPDWAKLKEIGDQNRAKKPATLEGWARMFDDIYPRSEATFHEKNFIRLTEELGEVAEGIRALPIAREYFLSEVADVFAWLMGEANQIRWDRKGQKNPEFLEDALYAEYPGECRYCYSSLCKCPPILQNTLGRLAHDTPSSAFSSVENNLFSPEEALIYFKAGDEVIRIGSERYDVTSEMLQEVQKTSHAILGLLAENKETGIAANTKLVLALERIDGLASQQRITQESVEATVQAIKDLPAGPKGLVMDYLKAFGSGIWLQLLFHALGM